MMNRRVGSGLARRKVLITAAICALLSVWPVTWLMACGEQTAQLQLQLAEPVITVDGKPAGPELLAKLGLSATMCLMDLADYTSSSAQPVRLAADCDKQTSGGLLFVRIKR